MRWKMADRKGDWQPPSMWTSGCLNWPPDPRAPGILNLCHYQQQQPEMFRPQSRTRLVSSICASLSISSRNLPLRYRALPSSSHPIKCRPTSTIASTNPNIQRVFPTSGFEVIDPAEEVEEETLPTYDVGKYYPVRLGEVLDGRYQVVAKLGYGVTSTVWLGRDLRYSSFHSSGYFQLRGPLLKVWP